MNQIAFLDLIIESVSDYIKNEKNLYVAIRSAPSADGNVNCFNFKKMLI